MQKQHLQLRKLWLLITIVFSIVNVAFAILNFMNSKEQRKSQEIGLKINLSQKRLDIYEKEKIVLENIINQNSLTSFELSELCNAEHESVFFFGNEIKTHIDSVCELALLVSDSYKNNSTIEDEIVNELHRKDYSDKATELFVEAIDIYDKYINFCDIGIQKR